MRVLVNGKIEVLEMIDPKSKVNCATDIIGNHGGLSDGQFRYNEEADAYECTPETFEWWKRVLADHQTLEDMIAELAELIEEHGSDKVHEVVNSVGDYDLEDQPAAIRAALDEAFGK